MHPDPDVAGIRLSVPGHALTYILVDLFTGMKIGARSEPANGGGYRSRQAPFLFEKSVCWISPAGLDLPGFPDHSFEHSPAISINLKNDCCRGIRKSWIWRESSTSSSSSTGFSSEESVPIDCFCLWRLRSLRFQADRVRASFDCRPRPPGY